MNELGKNLLKYWTDLGEAWEQERAAIEAATGWTTFNPIKDDQGWFKLRLELYPPEEGGLMVVGLNPGLYGMAQTGMPFTDQGVIAMRLPKLLAALLAKAKGTWKGERGQAPDGLLPFLNPSNNSENSSWPVYELLTRLYGSAEKGLEQAFLLNPCPLVFVDSQPDKDGDYNRTPDDVCSAVSKAKSGERPRLFHWRLDDIRRTWTLQAAEILKPSAILLLGENNRDKLGPSLREAYSSAKVKPAVVSYDHPAIPPRTWAESAQEALARDGYKPKK